jgi:hypothetical protein
VLRPRPGVGAGILSAADPHGRRSAPGRHLAAEGLRGEPFAGFLSSTRSRECPAPLADPARTGSGPTVGPRDLLLLLPPRRQTSPLPRCLSARAYPRASANRGRSAGAPVARRLGPVRAAAHFAENARASASPPRRASLLADRVSRSGTNGGGQPTEVKLHIPASPDRGSTAPDAPQLPRRSPESTDRTALASRGRGDRRDRPRGEKGAGGARSDRDARPLGNRPRPETSADPRCRCTDDPRRPPPPGTHDRDGEPPARARPRREGPRRLDRPTRRLGSRADPPSPLVAKSSVAPAARAGGGGGAGPPADRPPDARKGCRSRTAPPLQARVRPLEGRGLALGPWGLPDRGPPPGERFPGCTCPTSRIGEDPAPLCGPSPWPRRDQRRRRPLEFDRLDSRTRWPRPRTFVRRRLCRWDLIEIKSSFSDLV